MMDNKQQNHIFLLNFNQESRYTLNPVKEFLHLLKSQGHKGVINFSYSNGTDSIHAALSLKENFILDSVPTSLIKDDENNLSDYLDKVKNIHFSHLLALLGPLHQKIVDLSPEQIQVASIVKAMLSDSKYILLSMPENSLNATAVQLVKDAILFEVSHNDKVFYIYSSQTETWTDISTTFISKCHESNKYLSKANPLNIQEISNVISLANKKAA